MDIFARVSNKLIDKQINKSNDIVRIMNIMLISYIYNVSFRLRSTGTIRSTAGQNELRMDYI